MTAPPGGQPAPDDPEDRDPGLARERTSLAWTRTAISFAALGGAVLKVSVTFGLIILAMAAVVWRLGWMQRPGAQRLWLITVSVIVVAVLSLVIALTGPDAALQLPRAGPLGYGLFVTMTSQALDLTGLPEITRILAAGAEANDRDAELPRRGHPGRPRGGPAHRHRRRALRRPRRRTGRHRRHPQGPRQGRPVGRR